MVGLVNLAAYAVHQIESANHGQRSTYLLSAFLPALIYVIFLGSFSNK